MKFIIIAQILPSFNREKSLQVYKELLRELLEKGNVNSANSLEVLSKIRQELDIAKEPYFIILNDLGTENPDLLSPLKPNTLEKQLRLQSYRQALEPQLLELFKKLLMFPLN